MSRTAETPTTPLLELAFNCLGIQWQTEEYLLMVLEDVWFGVNTTTRVCCINVVFLIWLGVGVFDLHHCIWCPLI